MLLGKAPGRLVNGFTRASQTEHRNSLRAQRTRCRLAPALRRALANSRVVDVQDCDEPSKAHASEIPWVRHNHPLWRPPSHLRCPHQQPH
eukprot:11981821-Karenia_brevis.AAC.1